MDRVSPLWTAAALVAAALCFAPAASAGQVPLYQCHPGWGLPGYDSRAWSTNAIITQSCGAGGAIVVTTPNHRLDHYADAKVAFTLPGSMPSTTIDSFSGSVVSRPQVPSPNPAYFQVFGEGVRLLDHALGGVYTHPFPLPSGARSFGFAIWCSPANGPGTCNWAADVMTLGAMTINVRESAAPTAGATGALLSPGAQSGTKAIRIVARDADTGIKSSTLTLGGVLVASRSESCRYDLLPPCPQHVDEQVDVDTRAVPDGTRTLRLTTVDAAGNAYSTDVGTVVVDNVPPPTNTRPPAVSGLPRHGQILTADAGTWLGTAVALGLRWQRQQGGLWEDIANATGGTYAVKPADYGRPLRLRVRAANADGTTDAYSEPTEPIAAPADPEPPAAVPTAAPSAPVGSAGLPAHTSNGHGATASAVLVATFEGTLNRTIKLPWGATRRITGTLLGVGEQPIVGARLDVRETPHLLGAAARPLGQVVTDARGRFSYQLPAGVSRTLRFAYKHVLESSSDARTTEVVVQVVPKVTLRADRRAAHRGQRVTFAGRIAGAPAGVRKRVALQVLEAGQWRTVASSRVASRGGTFRARLRLERTGRVRHRALVRAESGWPFAAGHSPTVRVDVRP